MTVTELLPVQVSDPQRGSFYVKVKPVRDKNGRPIRRRGRVVKRGSNHVHGFVVTPHPQAIEFIVR